MSKKQECFAAMAAVDDDSASDGAWQAMLEDAVHEFNRQNNTNFDSFDMFIEYVQR